MEDEEAIDKLFWKIIRLHGIKMHKIIHSIEGIHPGQQHLLHSLLKKNGQSQKELASSIYVKPSTINVSINRLEKNGYVEKIVDENDNRISRVYITEKGQKIALKVKKEIKEVEKLTFTNITDKEKDILRDILIKLYKNLDDGEYDITTHCNKK